MVLATGAQMRAWQVQTWAGGAAEHRVGWARTCCYAVAEGLSCWDARADWSCMRVGGSNARARVL